jgi:hypothetical protein
LLLNGVDDDMLTATRDYFRKLLANLDRMIDQAGSRRRGNARKPARDRVWTNLLEIWCEFGGKATGTAAALFLRAASLPMMGGAVPDIPSIMRWLKRRQRRTTTVVKPGAASGSPVSRGQLNSETAS